MKITDAHLQDSLSAAKILMATRFPLCYSLVQNCRVVFTDSPRIQTAAVTPDDVIYVSPHFWEKLNMMERVFLLSHEVFHPAFDYFLRSGGLHPKRSNYAHDYVINLMLDELIPGGFIKGGRLDSQYAGLSFEEVYSRLKDEPDDSDDGGGDSSQDSSPSHGGKGLRDDAMPIDVIGDADPNSDSDYEGAPSKKSSEELREKSFKWQQRLNRAFEFNAMQQGTLPDSVRSQIENRLTSKVCWENQLHCAMGEILGKVCSDYNRMNRRSNANYSDLAHPAERFRSIDVAIYVDTSGSISQNQLERGFAEIEEICRQTNGRVRFLEGDTGIYTDEYISDLPEDVKGGGGTSFVPVFEHLEENPEKTKALVCFTDTWGRMPDFTPDLHVIWAVYSECIGLGINVPFGEVIEIPPDLF